MTTTPEPVTVIGLGAMGQALARAFLAAGHPTTVWNRTAARADDLVTAGANLSSGPAEAVAASPLVVVCLLDLSAVDAVLDAAGDAVGGRTIVNLTSSVPDDARTVAARVTAAGASYLDGKIMVPTPLVGTDDALVLYAGDAEVFATHERTLKAIGPDADLLGDDPALAALFDLGMLDVFFNGMAAYLHASALVGADGIAADAFLPYADRVLDVLRFSMQGLAADVDRGEHPGDEDTMEMNGRALDHIVEASTARGIDTTVPETVLRLVRAAEADGHRHDGFSRVIDHLRRPERAPVTVAS